MSTRVEDGKQVVEHRDLSGHERFAVCQQRSRRPAAACKAKKEELSLAIGLSLAFTVVMMVVMPRVILAMDLDPRVGGAWIGGTIDSTGAVAAAGEALGKKGATLPLR